MSCLMAELVSKIQVFSEAVPDGSVPVCFPCGSSHSLYKVQQKEDNTEEGGGWGGEVQEWGWGGMLQLYSLQSPVGLVRKNSCEIII